MQDCINKIEKHLAKIKALIETWEAERDRLNKNPPNCDKHLRTDISNLLDTMRNYVENVEENIISMKKEYGL